MASMYTIRANTGPPAPHTIGLGSYVEVGGHCVLYCVYGVQMGQIKCDTVCVDVGNQKR
jgi:hypothetical protein